MRKYFWLIFILAFATALRFYHNTDISLWHDEAFSALLIKYPWGEMMHRIGLDVHPPMYYIFLRFWNYIFGDSLLALRAMTVFFSVGTIWAAWIFVKEAFKNEKAALWVAILVALNPFQLQYATEARMYTMGAFFALLACYFLVIALRHQRQLHKDESLKMPNLPADINHKKKMIWHFVGFTISMIIIIYTHYYLFFTAAAIGFYGIAYLFYHYKWDWKKYMPILISYVLILISYLPWIKTFIFQYSQVSKNYWIPKMDVWSIPATLWQMFLGIGIDIANKTTQLQVAVVALLVLFIIYRFLRKTQAPEKWLVLLVFIGPFAGSFLFLLLAKLQGSETSVFLVRYFLFTTAFLSIIVAVWLKEIRIKWLAVFLFSVYVLVNLGTFYNYWDALDVKNKIGMAGASKYITANIEPQHKLYVGSSFMFFNLKYYISQEYKCIKCVKPKPLLFSGGNTEVRNMPHYAGTAILTNEDLLPKFGSDVARGDTVWLVWTNGFGGSKPDIPSDWDEIDEKSFAEVRPYVGTFVYVTEYKVD